VYFYQVIKEEFYRGDIGDYVSFGIRVIYATYGIYCEVLRVSDISPDKHNVSELASLCTKAQLRPIHLLDVIEDYTKAL
jgi:hypothetical protein